MIFYNFHYIQKIEIFNIYMILIIANYKTVEYVVRVFKVFNPS